MVRITLEGGERERSRPPDPVSVNEEAGERDEEEEEEERERDEADMTEEAETFPQLVLNKREGDDLCTEHSDRREINALSREGEREREDRRERQDLRERLRT